MLRESRRRHAYLSTKKHVTREHWKCWPVRRIVALLHLCLSQPFATFGNSVWMQRQGVPIGGLVSGALCSVLLGLAEFRRTSHGAGGSAQRARTRASPARHDCDMLMTKSGSRLLTATPAWKNSSVKYTRRVSSSSPTSNGTNKAEWLDIVVEVETWMELLTCVPKKPELEWAHRP